MLSNDKVNLIKTSANNGLETPAGLTVGQKIQVVYDLYDSPQFTSKFPNGETRHLYKNKLGEIKESHYMNMPIIEKRGKIIEIKCYETYEGGTIPIGVEF